jgi:hypothetical protein
MKFNLVKLDRRHTGYSHWKYFVELKYSLSYTPLHEQNRDFYEWREWCWEQWGASKELHDFDDRFDLFDGTYSSNAKWCWLNRDGTRRIYLKNTEEASAFTLRWS